MFFCIVSDIANFVKGQVVFCKVEQNMVYNYISKKVIRIHAFEYRMSHYNKQQILYRKTEKKINFSPHIISDITYF